MICFIKKSNDCITRVRCIDPGTSGSFFFRSYLISWHCSHNKWPFMYNDKCIIIVDADRLLRECPIINRLSPLRSRGRGADRSNFDLSNLSFQISYLIYTIFSLSSWHLVWTKCQRILAYCIYYRNWFSVQYYMHLFVRFTVHLLIYIA